MWGKDNKLIVNTDFNVKIEISFDEDNTILSSARSYWFNIVNLNGLPSPHDPKIMPTIWAIIEEFFRVNPDVLLYLCDTADDQQVMRARLFQRWFNLYEGKDRFIIRQVEIPDEKKRRLLDLRVRGHRVFLLSNTNSIHWDYCVEQLFPYKNYGVADYFERIFLSQEMHLQKPDAEIFNEVLRQTGIRAEDSIFIDDLPENCEAARSVGIQAFQNTNFDDWELFLDRNL